MKCGHGSPTTFLFIFISSPCFLYGVPWVCRVHQCPDIILLRHRGSLRKKEQERLGGVPSVRWGKTHFTLPDLGGKWFGTFGGSDELIDQAGMGFRVQESELSEVIE